MRAERGFTLLEVMVALAVFGLLAAAVLSASQYVLHQAGTLQERLFASWLVDNQLAELRLQPSLEVGRQQLVRHFDRRQWRLSQSLTPAFDKRLIRVELQVRVGDSQHVVYRGTGWLPIVDGLSGNE